MAEFIAKELVRQQNLQEQFYISSAATSTEEIGNDIYPPAKRVLGQHNIPCERHSARQITPEDYDKYDLIVCMDRNNMRNIRHIIPNDPEGKIHLLLDFTERTPGTEVADPWYTGNFDATWRDCLEGCTALLRKCGCE